MRLTALQRYVVRCRLGGHTLDVIARDRKVTRPAIVQLIRRAMRQLPEDVCDQLAATGRRDMDWWKHRNGAWHRHRRARYVDNSSTGTRRNTDSTFSRYTWWLRKHWKPERPTGAFSVWRLPR